MRDARRWVGARGINARQHLRIDWLFPVVDEELQVSCRRRDFGLGKAIDKFVQLLFAHRTAPPPLQEFYREGDESRHGYLYPHNARQAFTFGIDHLAARSWSMPNALHGYKQMRGTNVTWLASRASRFDRSERAHCAGVLQFGL